jgi:hypothetical protein
VIHHSRFYRLFGVLAMAMQLLLPPALTVADSVLERDERGVASSHIEDHTRAGCRPAHNADCAICRTLSNLSAPKGSAPCIAIALDAPAIGRVALFGSRPAEPWVGPPPSRAPPA